jgi:MoxR-like ATPase
MAATNLRIVDARVQCNEPGCEFKSHSILDHIQEAHGMSVDGYLGKHPGAATVSSALIEGVKDKRKGRRRTAAPALTHLSHDMMGITVPVTTNIAESQCLPKPEGYQWPTAGKAMERTRRVVLALRRGRPVFYWGPSGTGKDAAISAFCADARVPSLIYTFTSGTDVKRWFYSRELDANGTSWSYGRLWHAIVNGIEAADGSRHAALICFSDVDRGTPEQLEEFRLMLDTTSKRLVGPTGEVHTLFPGTRFAFTANSCGTGDVDGRMSSRAMDASLLDRMGRFVEAEYLDWKDEGAILRAKFADLAGKAPVLFDELGSATVAIRAAISGESTVDLEADLTHRGLCEILAECDDNLWMAGGTVPKGLLKKGFKAWLDRLDPDNRLIAKSLIDAHVTGGVFADEDL